MSQDKFIPTLDRPVPYQVKVPGVFDEWWPNWDEEMIISIEQGKDRHPITTLTACLDQAALQGLLRDLYSLGLPLISVVCLDSV